MGDCNIIISGSDAEEDVIAAADYIVRVVRSGKNLSNNVHRILADLSAELSLFLRPSDDPSKKVSDLERRLSVIRQKVMSWEVDQSIFDSGPDEASDYLSAVDEVQKMIVELETLCSETLDKNGAEYELLRRAHDIQETAMARLEEEFRNMLVQNRQYFEPEHMSFRSSEEDTLDEGSTVSLSNDSFDSFHRRSASRISEDFVYDSVLPDVVPDLRRIADIMFTSHYNQECSFAYIGIRKEALDEALSVFDWEKLSIEDVLKMEWDSLNSRIKRWIRTIKIFVRVHLSSEKNLCDQIFGELESVSSLCFVEASKAAMSQLLNFGDAVSIGPHKPEKLFSILDMYEMLANILPDIDTVYSDQAGSLIKTECHAVSKRLGDSVARTFLDFKNAIASETATYPLPKGEVHQITKYVMNYLRNLTDYIDTLNELLKGHDIEDSCFLLPDMRQALDENNGEDTVPYTVPMALHFQLVASILEFNLNRKSMLYKDTSLRHFFLMNNIHYMAQKVKDPELRLIFGDDWIRKQNRKFQQHSLDYQRAAWSSILSLLKDEGLQNHGSNSISRTLLRERVRNFNLAFEERYRSQTAWRIPDPQLREDLRIQTSLQVVQAYRTFIGRHSNHISERHIKFTVDDMQKYLWDLFEGSSKSLHNSYRRP